MGVLHIAVNLQRNDLIDIILMSDQVDINLMSPLHGTPLHIACKMGNIKIVQQLLINGADISIKSPKNGKLPKDISDNTRIAFLIEKYEQMKALEADDSSRSSGDEEDMPAQSTSKLNNLFSTIKQGVIKTTKKEP
mmetsp:Transcript_3679/g.5537  ORF Transcript_3679/g.5537 Transcript_3679/m.5537 type:complete len:136 (+) Transcript_3679:633-1040(+)